MREIGTPMGGKDQFFDPGQSDRARIIAASAKQLEEAMTPGEIAVLAAVIGAFIAFAATLAWYSR
jgi:hypothetical protein